MNIYAEEGSRVIYTGKGGYDYHRETANNHLTVGNTYEVYFTDVGGWHTDVYLKGFETIPFNSVMFEDVEEL